MKVMLSLTLGTLTSLSAIAGSPEEIYHALMVDEEALSAPRIELKTMKSVGGLACIKVNSLRDGTSYTCEADLDTWDSQAIYGALSMDLEKFVSAPKIQLKTAKAVGGLSCLRTREPGGSISLSCKLKF